MAKEQYSQFGYLEVTESAANTLTFGGLSVFSNVLGQKGMIIHRVQYLFSPADIAVLAAADDSVYFGLCGDDSLTTIGLDSASVYDFQRLDLNEYGTAASMLLIRQPFVTDFTGLPGMGKLVPADRVYAFLKGTALASAITVLVRFHYTIIDLSTADYLELAQSLRVLR